MIRNILFAALATTAVAALPAAADAQSYRDGYYGGRGYNDGYRHHRRDRGDYYGRGYGRSYGYTQVYVAPAYYPAYYGGGYYDPYYGQGYYPRGYYNRGYYGRGYYGCDNGTTGAIVGGAAGALVGSEIARDGRRYRYYDRGRGTTGALIGGAIGALIGSEAIALLKPRFQRRARERPPRQAGAVFVRGCDRAPPGSSPSPGGLVDPIGPDAVVRQRQARPRAVAGDVHRHPRPLRAEARPEIEGEPRGPLQLDIFAMMLGKRAAAPLVDAEAAADAGVDLAPLQRPVRAS